MLKGVKTVKTNFKKNILIEMAKKGNKKPLKNTLLFNALRNYMNKASYSYDESFSKTIKSLRPDWFPVEIEDIKEKILDFAKNNRKPDIVLFKKTKEFIDPKNRNYDPKFNILIKMMRPEWFIDTNTRRKQILIKMAKRGMKRPNCKGSLGRHLCLFVSKNNKYFDVEFNNEIKQIRPDWFRKI